jgi:NhaD family Na+/H+ antiporter
MIDHFNPTYFFVVGIFLIGYAAIIFENGIRINKTAAAIFIAVTCWAVYFLFSPQHVDSDIKKLAEHVSDIAQIIFFLMGAMTLVELIDAHRGFRIITDMIQTSSKKKMLWLISFITFFLSSVLDNLTTTILMVSLLRKLVPDREERLLLCFAVVVAANSGGAWTPIGDVTTTMLWINGQLSTFAVLKALFLPSLVSMIIPLVFFSFGLKGRYHQSKEEKEKMAEEPGGRLVFYLGIASLIFVPIFKAWTGLPPFLGIMIGLSVLWIVTDLLHYPYEHREHLRVPHILSRIDTPGILFFLGILLAVSSLEVAGVLSDVADLLNAWFPSKAMIATAIGVISAVIDNVPLVAATMGMYPLSEFPIDDSLWFMIAYAAGTGGSMLIIGSSSGVALMGLEKVDFFSYLKKATLPVFLGYLAGMGVYLLL